MTTLANVLQHTCALHLLLEDTQRRIDTVAVFEVNLYQVGSTGGMRKGPANAEPLKYCKITGYQLALRTLGRLLALSRNVPLMDVTTDLASSAER